MGEKYVKGNFYEVLYDYSFIDQSYEICYYENKHNIYNPCPTLIPVPGFCFLGRTQQNKSAYINICHAIELPNCNAYNSRIHIGSRDEESVLGFSLYLDDERLDKDENGKMCVCYDTIIQTEFMDAVLSHSRRDQRLYYLYQTACKAIYDRYNIRLEKDVELLKKFYHGTMPESFRNIFKRIGVISKLDEDNNNKEPYFSDPFSISTTVRRFITERKPEFDIKNPSIEFEFRQFPAEGDYKGFLLLAVLPYFSFLDPRDVKVFVSERKLLFKENKTNHSFYFDLPNPVSVMDCRIHFHEGKITVYLPRVNPASCRTLGQYRRRPDPPRIIPHESSSQSPSPQIRSHLEAAESEVTHSQIAPSQINHLPPTSQMPSHNSFPSHYHTQTSYPNMGNHRVPSSHISHSQTHQHPSVHFQTNPAYRNHFQPNVSRINQMQNCPSQLIRNQESHYQLPPSQNSSHISSQMVPPRMNPLPPMPCQVSHNRINPMYMSRYQNAPISDRHPLNHQSNLQMDRHGLGPTHIGMDQSASSRMEHQTVRSNVEFQSITPRIDRQAEQQTSTSCMENRPPPSHMEHQTSPCMERPITAPQINLPSTQTQIEHQTSPCIEKQMSSPHFEQPPSHIEHQVSSRIEHQASPLMQHQLPTRMQHTPRMPHQGPLRVQHPSRIQPQGLSPMEHQTPPRMEPQTSPNIENQALLRKDHQVSPLVEHQVPSLIEHQLPSKVEHQVPPFIEDPLPSHVEHQVPAHMELEISPHTEHQTPPCVEHQTLPRVDQQISRSEDETSCMEPQVPSTSNNEKNTSPCSRQISSTEMKQLQMASSHLSQLQTVLSRQVHLQEAPSLLARLQATLSQVENLKGNSLQSDNKQPSLTQPQDIEVVPKDLSSESSFTTEKASPQVNPLQIADLQAALNEISDLQKALLEAANFQVANLQAAIQQITAPQKEDSNPLPAQTTPQLVDNPNSLQSQSPPNQDITQTKSFTEPSCQESIEPSTITPTTVSSP